MSGESDMDDPLSHRHSTELGDDALAELNRFRNMMWAPEMWPAHVRKFGE